MSRSVSAPSSVTNTSPCWNGLIVPGSTLMYGSNFWTCTLRPRALRRRPSDAAVMPLPREETTPPVTNTNFATYTRLPAKQLTGFHVSSRGGCRSERRRGLHQVVQPFHRNVRVPAARGDGYARPRLARRLDTDLDIGRRLEQVPAPALVGIDLADHDHGLDPACAGEDVPLE